jgi:hypothetical protein
MTRGSIGGVQTVPWQPANHTPLLKEPESGIPATKSIGLTSITPIIVTNCDATLQFGH